MSFILKDACYCRVQCNKEFDSSVHYVDTVFGYKPLSELGITLVHEHLTSNFLCKMQSAPKENNDAKQDLYLSNMAGIKQYPYYYSKNLRLSDPDVIRIMDYELALFKFAGGKTIVEKSSYGLERNLQFLKLYSQTAGINIIVGTGYYTAMSQRTSELSKTCEELYENMLEEFSNGIKSNGCSGVYPAFIGEVGSNWPIHDFERKSIVATGELQDQVYCPVSLSPGWNDDAPMEILRIYQEAGGSIHRVIMSHVDHTFTSEEKLMEFVDHTNCFIQFDLFGSENSIRYKDGQFVEVPSDVQCLEYISCLKKENMLDRILMSHDIHTKNKLVSYGGQGYSYILNNIVPYMLKKDFKIHEIEQILIKNPQTWLYWF